MNSGETSLGLAETFSPVKLRVGELTKSAMFTVRIPLIHWRGNSDAWFPPYLPQMPVGDLTADAAKDEFANWRAPGEPTNEKANNGGWGKKQKERNPTEVYLSVPFSLPCSLSRTLLPPSFAQLVVCDLRNTVVLLA